MVEIHEKEETWNRYWRVTNEYDKHTIVHADRFTVDSRGNLVFYSSDHEEWGTTHTINKHYWQAVTECDKDGTPLWSRAMPENIISIESDISHADIEALSSYIESVADSAIRKATED